jgi:hypothetical protein
MRSVQKLFLPTAHHRISLYGKGGAKQYMTTKNADTIRKMNID